MHAEGGGQFLSRYPQNRCLSKQPADVGDAHVVDGDGYDIERDLVFWGHLLE